MTNLNYKLNGKNTDIIFIDKIDYYKDILEEDKNVFIFIDEKVDKLYGEYFNHKNKIVLQSKEINKNLNSINQIVEKLLKMGADRSSFFIGVGGGFVTDITGFLATIYMRGVDFGFIPTTLLSQVDASLGGKNGINYNNYKNILGTFSHPKFVIISNKYLQTLPKSHFINGLSEVVKYGLILDKDFFYFIKDNINKILSKKEKLLNKIITKSVNIKMNIVKKDIEDKNSRQKLNFGHTIGHPVEILNQIKHGEAVSIGMVKEASLSIRYGKFSQSDYKNIKDCLKSIGLPVKYNLNPNELYNTLKKDKKKRGDTINMAFLNKIGSSFIKNIKLKELKKQL